MMRSMTERLHVNQFPKLGPSNDNLYTRAMGVQCQKSPVGIVIGSFGRLGELEEIEKLQKPDEKGD